jgi:GNAT superfamily N-acetyltransferase
MTALLLRPAKQDDLEMLWVFLAIAAYEPDAAAAKAVPVVASHLAGWQRPSDFGLVAEGDAGVVGAAWARQFAPEEEPSFYLDDRTPEVTIAVEAKARRRGIGETLLRALGKEAGRRSVRLCLNVRDSNPAIHLYERVGFRRVRGAEVQNRVGGGSIGMVLDPRTTASARLC